MAFDAHVLKILIASPGDTTDERDAVERSLHGWNAPRAEREQVVLLPRRGETDAVPRLGDSGQSIINSQLVNDADIVIALFDSLLGQATQEAGPEPPKRSSAPTRLANPSTCTSPLSPFRGTWTPSS